MMGRMFEKHIRALIDLTRVDHGLMLAFAVLIGEIILTDGIPEFNERIILSLIVPIIIQMGAFSLNDYLDYEVDKSNGRFDRPLVRGDINKNTAKYIGWGCLAIGLLVSLKLGFGPFIIALIFTALSIIYDYWAKNIALVGNSIIAASMGIPFIFAGYVINSTNAGLLTILFLIAFTIGLAREIIKDVEDMPGEMEKGAKTLPILIGKKKTSIIASSLLMAFMIIAVIPFVLYFKIKMLSGLFLIGAYAFIGYSTGITMFSLNEITAGRIRNYLYIGMGLGIVSLCLAAVGL